MLIRWPLAFRRDLNRVERALGYEQVRAGKLLVALREVEWRLRMCPPGPTQADGQVALKVLRRAIGEDTALLLGRDQTTGTAPTYNPFGSEPSASRRADAAVTDAA